MAFTSSDLDAIEAAIKTGELVVQYADHSVTYRSIKELLDARAAIKHDIAAAAAKTSGGSSLYSIADFRDC